MVLCALADGFDFLFQQRHHTATVLVSLGGNVQSRQTPDGHSDRMSAKITEVELGKHFRRVPAACRRKSKSS